MKIKLFESTDIQKLEDKVNEFFGIMEHDKLTIISIQYTTPVTTEYWAEGERTANEHMYSVMIVYK